MSECLLRVKVQLTDGGMGETVTETIVIHPSEGDDKLNILNDEAKRAVEEATGKMDAKYDPGWDDKPPKWKRSGAPIEVCPRCGNRGGVPGDECERCDGTGRADGVSNL